MKTILSIIALISSLIVNAQTTVTLSQLKNTSWKIVKIEDRKVIDPVDVYSFSRENIVWSETNTDFSFTYKYYLTSTPPTKYVSSLVGKSTKGCYIVKYNPKHDTFIYFIIKTFDKSKGTMVLLPRSTEELIGGQAKEITYKLVKWYNTIL